MQIASRVILACTPRHWVQASSCSERSSLSEESGERRTVAAQNGGSRGLSRRVLGAAQFPDLDHTVCSQHLRATRDFVEARL
jgi:hypothetical protein